MKKITIVFVALLCLLAGFNYTTYSQTTYKGVLMENFTSSTCPPCASNNPLLRQWLAENHANLVAVSYHVGWPSPGNDPMYLFNPVQSYDRRYYYGVNAVPEGILMGIHVYIGSPFPFSTMTTYYNLYSGQTTPTKLVVDDTRIPPDSNKVNITVINYSTLPSGNYALRVMAVERWIIYSSPPGTNGETEFQNVFRRSFPNSQGTQVPLAAGTYNFEFRYKIDPVWNDTSIYTIAFVQNDNDKTLSNASREGILTGIEPYVNQIPSSYALGQNYPNPFNPVTYIKVNLPKDDYVTLKVYDILGNEIQTLVDGHFKAGIYNVDFDGSNLASGIYLYTLKAGNFVDTKKMIMVK